MSGLSLEPVYCGVCPETANTGLIDPSLACSTGKPYGFTNSGVVPKVFQGIIQSQNGVRMYGVQLV